jgi:peptide/nickel transport system ATP-binding protein
VLGLVGESGCGKTATMMGITGLLPPSASLSGNVCLRGENLLAEGEKSIRPHRWRDIAMVFQGAMSEFSPVNTIGAQIVEPQELHKVAKGAAARSRAEELLELVGVNASVYSRFPHELSGGMRQRAAIAMALACDPCLVVADEPTTALDVIVQKQVLVLLRRLALEKGLAVVLVSHDLPLVAEVSDRICVMYAGQPVEVGDTTQVFDHPLHPYTAGLVAATPDIDDEEIPLSIPGVPPRLDEPLEGCAFAPRCTLACGDCWTREQPLLEIRGRSVRCCAPEASA